MSADTSHKGLIIAAPSSGSGKTVVTLGLLSALKQAGINVASLKSGPDYIDPVFHAQATDKPCYNLDPWAMRPETVAGAMAQVGMGADLLVTEGVMGLFDGATLDAGSTSDIAKLTGWPVIMVVDARAQGASAAATVLGFDRFDPDVNVAGVIFNRVGSEKHQRVIRQAMARVLPDVPVLGMIPWDEGLELPSRHLGLVQAAEHPDLTDMITRAGHVVARHVDLAALQSIASAWSATGEAKPLAPLGQRIAVARDEAFAFAYPLVLDGWRRQGVEISFFSPLDDEAPASDADAVFLPGGYPELHAYRLASAERFLDGIRDAANDGKTVYGECGGYMVLGRGMRDADGTTHAMAGVLPLGTTFEDRKLHLGYRRLVLIADTPLGRIHAKFKGHEFHYATVTNEGPGQHLFDAADAGGQKIGPVGQAVGNVFGSFVHLIDRDTKG